MRVNGILRTGFVVAAATFLLPNAALAQPKSSPQSPCQSRFEALRSIRASLSSPEIYPRIAADLAAYERELFAQLDKDFAAKTAAGRRASDTPGPLRSAADERDGVANVHRSKTDERYKDSARFFVARNELDACLLRARLARVENAESESAAKQAAAEAKAKESATKTREPAAKAKEPQPSGPLDQAALNRLSWDELTGVYQRVISMPKPDLEYARRIVQTALRRFPDHKNAPGARGVLAQIDKQLAASQPDVAPPPAPRSPPERPGASKLAEAPLSERAAPPGPAETAPLDRARLERMTIDELIALMKQTGPEFQRAVGGKMSDNGRLQPEKLSAADRRSLAVTVPLMRTILQTMVARFPQHEAVVEAPAYIAFFTAIERDLGLSKAAVTLASRPNQSALDRLQPDELASLFFEFGAKSYPDEKSREEDLRIVRMALQTAVTRHPKHPFAAQARKILDSDEAERKRRAAVAALPPPAASPPPAVPPVPAAPAPVVPAAPVAREPSLAERVLQTILGWLGFEVRPAGS